MIFEKHHAKKHENKEINLKALSTLKRIYRQAIGDTFRSIERKFWAIPIH